MMKNPADEFLLAGDDDENRSAADGRASMANHLLLYTPACHMVLMVLDALGMELVRASQHIFLAALMQGR